MGGGKSSVMGGGKGNSGDAPHAPGAPPETTRPSRVETTAEGAVVGRRLFSTPPGETGADPAGCCRASGPGTTVGLGVSEPLGVLNDADQERFDRLRYVEIKHGRICQLGVLGWLTTSAGVRLPGF